MWNSKKSDNLIRISFWIFVSPLSSVYTHLPSLIHIVFGLFTLKIYHLSLKRGLFFNKFNSFNVNIEHLTIYRTNILKQLSHKR